MKITVTTDLDTVMKKLATDLARQVPFATAVALTRTAQAARAVLKKDIASTFDRPTPWVRNSPFATPARRDRLEATVGIRDSGAGRSPAHYVREHVAGGQRGQKPFERAMQSMGVLPAGWKAMPAIGLRRDRFGNPNRRQLAEVLGSLRSRMGIHSGRGKHRDVLRYFVVRPNDNHPRVQHLAAGVWRRYGNARHRVEPMFVFVRVASYQAMFDVPGIVGQVVEKEFPGQFARAFDDALKSARR